MNINNFEVPVEVVVSQESEASFRSLTELQLSAIGGGIGDPMVG